MVLWIAATCFGVWALFLYAEDANLTLDVGDGGRTLVIHCEPLSEYGLDNRRHLETTYDESTDDVTTYDESTYDTPPSDIDDDGLDYEILNSYCDRARTANAAGIGLLAVPTSVLAVLGFLMRRRSPKENPRTRDVLHVGSAP